MSDELEDPIDYEYGVRALKQAGYCAICQVYTYGRPHHHGPRMSADAEVRVDHSRASIGEYAARVTQERDEARAEVKHLTAAIVMARDYLALDDGKESMALMLLKEASA